jgi:beta-1,4-mannosyl-glycoprotein beta-1,4-N-acetylglucosaminyltransferase
MKIFDCFTFFNELELLDLRLMVLSEYVDFFVLVEANKTHTGKTKEFIFEQNKDKFSDYLDKIIYVKVKDLPDYSKDDIWIAENFQRNCITRGLETAELGDKIIISDIDEIPNPDIVIQNLGTLHPVTMIQKLFYYYVNCLQNQPWRKSILVTYKDDDSPQQLRNMAKTNHHAVPNGGWHYSFMGSAEKVKIKVENIAESHLIIDRVGDISGIKRKMETQQDLWNRVNYTFQKQIVDISINGMAPKCINKFIEKYPDFFFNR